MEVTSSSPYRSAVYETYSSLSKGQNFSFFAEECLAELDEKGPMWINYVKTHECLSQDFIKRKFLIERINNLVHFTFDNETSEKNNLKNYLLYKCFKNNFDSAETFIKNGTLEDTTNATNRVIKFLKKIEGGTFLSDSEKSSIKNFPDPYGIKKGLDLDTGWQDIQSDSEKSSIKNIPGTYDVKKSSDTGWQSMQKELRLILEWLAKSD